MIGNIYIDDYPESVAQWCNENNAYIEEIEPIDGHRRFQVVAVPEPEPPTAQDIINQYDTAIENWLDSTVQQRNYKNVESCISYVGDANPKYAREAEAVKAWRSAVYTEAENILAIYLGSNAYLDNASMPTIEQVIAELPQLNWNDPVEEVRDGEINE